MLRWILGVLIALVIVIKIVGISIGNELLAFPLLPFPRPGKVYDTLETSNHSFKVRLTARHERNGGFLPGAYYKLESASNGSEKWAKVFQEKADDPRPIPKHRIRFVGKTTVYSYMRQNYAVTVNGGASWSVWNVAREFTGDDPPYGILAVTIRQDGAGKLLMRSRTDRQPRIELHTKDYGQHWMRTDS